MAKAKLVVSVKRFEEGDFPPVCALTGEPATTSRRLVVVGRGAFGDEIVMRRRMFGRGGGLGRVVGSVPLSEAAERRTAVIERSRAALAVVATTGFVSGLFLSMPLLLASTTLAVLLGFSLLLTVGGEIDKTGRNVVLLHVHPEFASAVRHDHSERS